METESVSLAAESTEDMLLEWLNELIFRCETQHRLYTRFDVALDETGRRLDGDDRRRADRPLAAYAGPRGQSRDPPRTEPDKCTTAAGSRK